MRHLKLCLLSSFLITVSSSMAAESAGKCIFGTDASNLETAAKAAGLRPSKPLVPKAPSDLNKMEFNMVVDTVISESKDSGADVEFDYQTEVVQEFIKSEGYLLRIYGAYGKYIGFTVVVSYPGDNVYGTIYGLTRKSDGKIDFSQVAILQDGAIEKCSVKN